MWTNLKRQTCGRSGRWVGAKTGLECRSRPGDLDACTNARPRGGNLEGPARGRATEKPHGQARASASAFASASACACASVSVSGESQLLAVSDARPCPAYSSAVPACSRCGPVSRPPPAVSRASSPPSSPVPPPAHALSPTSAVFADSESESESDPASARDRGLLPLSPPSPSSARPRSPITPAVRASLSSESPALCLCLCLSSCLSLSLSLSPAVPLSLSLPSPSARLITAALSSPTLLLAVRVPLSPRSSLAALSPAPFSSSFSRTRPPRPHTLVTVAVVHELAPAHMSRYHAAAQYAPSGIADSSMHEAGIRADHARHDRDPSPSDSEASSAFNNHPGDPSDDQAPSGVSPPLLPLLLIVVLVSHLVRISPRRAMADPRRPQTTRTMRSRPRPSTQTGPPSGP